MPEGHYLMVSRRKIGPPLLQEPMLKTVDISISHHYCDFQPGESHSWGLREGLSSALAECRKHEERE